MSGSHPGAAPGWMAGVAILPVLVIAVLSAIVRARRQKGRPTGSGEVILEYGWLLKALPAISVVLWAVLLVGLAITEPPQASDAPIFLGIVAGVVVLLVPLAMEIHGVAHRLSTQGIERVSPWSPPLTVLWTDVRSVKYEPSARWYVVESPRGKIRLPLLLDGLDAFRSALEAKVPRDRWARAFPGLAAPPRPSPRWDPLQPTRYVLGPNPFAHTPNRAAGGILLGVGVMMSAFAWYEALREGQFGEKGALFGPLAIVVGIGLLVHGPAMGRMRVNYLSRIYAVCGTLAGLGNLYLLTGEVDRILLLLPLLWLLPAWVFGRE
jgi:hypothetical protein